MKTAGKASTVFVLIISVISLAVAPTVQHHPFSELFPPDENLDFGQNSAFNLSKIDLNNGIKLQGSDIRDSGNTDRLRINPNGNGDVVVPNGNLINTGGQVLIRSGSESSPGLAFNSNTDTGIMSPQSGRLSIIQSGSRAVTYQSGGIYYGNELIVNSRIRTPSIQGRSGVTEINFDDNNNVISVANAELQVPSGGLKIGQNKEGASLNVTNDRIVGVATIDGSEGSDGDVFRINAKDGGSQDDKVEIFDETEGSVIAQFKENGNTLKVPNGNIKATGGNIILNRGSGSNAFLNYEPGGTPEWQAGYRSSDGSYTIYDNTNSQYVLEVQDGGDIKIPNGKLNLSGNRITNLASPSSGTDAVNKNYVDSSDDTVSDNQTLQDVLSRGNSAGSYNINLSENDLQDVYQVRGQDSNVMLRFTDSGNIFVKNGGFVIADGSLNLKENKIRNVKRVNFTQGSNTGHIQEYSGDALGINSVGGPLRLQNANSQNIYAESRINMRDNDLRNVNSVDFSDSGGHLWTGPGNTRYVDTNGSVLMKWNNGGPVKVKNSQFKIANGKNLYFRYSGTDEFNIGHNGAGDLLTIRDNDQKLMQFNNNGPVEVRNSNLSLNVNSIKGVNTVYGSGSNSLELDGGSSKLRTNDHHVVQYDNDDDGQGTFRVQDGSGTEYLRVTGGGKVKVRNGNLDMTNNDVEDVSSLSYRIIEINGSKKETFESASINSSGEVKGGDWGTWYNNDGNDADITLGGNYKGNDGVQVSCAEAIRSPNINNEELQDSGEVGRIYAQAWVRQYNDNEWSRVRISTDGGSSYQTIKIMDNNDGNNEWSRWHRISIDITPYVNSNPSSKIYLKFQDKGGGCGDDLQVDEVQLVHAPNRGAWNTGFNGKLFYATGKVGIGTSNPSSKLDIGGGAISSDGNGVDFNEELYVDDTEGVYVAGEDLAEKYHSRQDLEKGTIVRISRENNNSVERTNGRFDSTAGVVSTRPGYTLGWENGSQENVYPIALTGKVPVKVNMEGGAIEKGDRIAPSSVPGVGMKCEIKPLDEVEGFKKYRQRAEHNRKCRDSSIGKALESTDEKSKILVKVEG